jgi:hypothetical protein
LASAISSSWTTALTKSMKIVHQQLARGRQRSAMT